MSFWTELLGLDAFDAARKNARAWELIDQYYNHGMTEKELKEAFKHEGLTDYAKDSKN